MGGVGAGNFMINQAGTFGPWTFGDDSLPEHRILSQAAFHIRTQSSGSTVQTKTLAVNSSFGSVLSAWNTLNPGQGTYSALYPFGWIHYKGLATGVSMRFWSPIVARSDYYTSMPVAYFDLRLTNPRSVTQHVSTMFTFPNAAEHAGSTYQGPAVVRTGLSSSYRFDRRSDIAGVTLASSNPTTTADAKDSEWTIAVKPQRGQKVSYTTSWNAAGDGGDVYAPFKAKGALPDKRLDTSASAGAVAVATVLAPHHSTVVRFILSWDFPQETYGSSANTVWMRRYTDFFGARETSANNYIAGSYRFHQAFHIADRLLAEHDQALAAVNRWWLPIATNPAYPAWLRTAALNELYYVTWGQSFWEGGFVSTSDSYTNGGPRIGSQVPGTHLFFNVEGGNYNDANCWDCYAYAYQATQQLFPDMARDLIRGWTSMILGNPAGFTPHDAGGADPWIQWANTFQPSSVPASYPAAYADEEAKYIYVAYSYYRATHDAAFLRFTYPAMLKTFQYIEAHVPPGDHLPVDPPAQTDTYDGWEMVGHGIYNSELYLLAEQVMIAATRDALTLGVPKATSAELQALRTELPRSQSTFESDFWDPLPSPIGPHYTIDTGSPEYGKGIMADALFAQHIAEDLGLPDLVNPRRIIAHLETAYPLLTQFTDSTGHVTGAANGVNDLGSEIRTSATEGNEVWVGTTWMLAATLYHEGVRFHNPALKADALVLGKDLYYQIYDNLSNGFAFGEPEAYGVTSPSAYRDTSYLRPRAVWELLTEIEPVHIPNARPEHTRTSRRRRIQSTRERPGG